MKIESLAPKDLKKLIEVLYWYAYDSTLTQAEISDMMDLSPTAVSRFLKQSKNAGWIKTKHILNIPDEYKKHLPPSRNTTLEKDILYRFRDSGLRKIFVIKSGKKAFLKRRYLYSEAAKIINDFLIPKPISSDPFRILVAWGYTIRTIIDSLTVFNDNIDHLPVEIYPFLGDFPLANYEMEFEENDNSSRMREKFVKQISRYSANQNAKALSQTLNIKHEPIPITSPALFLDPMGNKIGKKVKPLIELLFSCDYTLKKLYGIPGTDDLGVACKVDTFLTSIGSNIPELSESVVGPEYSQKTKATIGSENCFNIAGILFNKAGRELPSAKRSLIGPNLETIKKISLNHIALDPNHKRKGAGVLVVGFSRQKKGDENKETQIAKTKSMAIKILLKNKVINTLILDESTAKAL